MRKVILAALTAALVSTVVVGIAYSTRDSPAWDWLDSTGIKRDVRHSFKYPDSVIFGNISVYLERKACVDISAKNTLGYHVGPKTYYAIRVDGKWGTVERMHPVLCAERASSLDFNLSPGLRQSLEESSP